MSDPQLIGGGALTEAPHVRMPGGGLFGRRAERFAALAPGHAAGDFLTFLGRLSAAQAAAAERVHLPLNGRDLPASRPLDVQRPRPPEWHEALRIVLAEIAPAQMPAPARSAVERLGRMGAEELEALAGRVLALDLSSADLAAGSLVAAGLQVVYGSLASRLPPEAVARASEGCPACGFPPAVGVVLGDDKLRYLVCGLCGTEWHHTRVQCVLCRSGAALSYIAIDGDGGPARAEACGTCQAYLKLLYVERAPRLEPLADDVASLALDLLVAEQGHRRLGVNPLLLAAGS